MATMNMMKKALHMGMIETLSASRILRNDSNLCVFVRVCVYARACACECVTLFQNLPILSLELRISRNLRSFQTLSDSSYHSAERFKTAPLGARDR